MQSEKATLAEYLVFGLVLIQSLFLTIGEVLMNSVALNFWVFYLLIFAFSNISLEKNLLAFAVYSLLYWISGFTILIIHRSLGIPWDDDFIRKDSKP